MNTKLLSTAGIVLVSGLATSALAQSDLERAYIAAARSDADSRASLLQDSEQNIKLGGLIQFRYTASFENGFGGDDDSAIGFSMPRAQIEASGAVTDNVIFKIEGDFGNTEGGSEGTFTLKDAYAAFVHGDWIFAAGQLKAPLLTEELIAPEFQLSAERSLVNEFFTGGYTQGIAGIYTSDKFRFTAALSDGANAGNSSYTSAAEADFSITGRAEFIFGDAGFDDFAAFTSFRDGATGFKVGLAAHWQTGGETIGTADVDVLRYTADIMGKMGGWNFFAAVVGQHVEVNATDTDIDDIGFVAQAGVFLSDQVELFGRWDTIMFDEDRGFDEDDVHFLTAGFNYYVTPRSHAVKFTGDVGYAFETFDAATVDPNGVTGWIGGEDGELLIRGQMTIAF